MNSIDYLDPDVLYQEIETPKIIKQIEYIFANSPFYQQKFTRSGITMADAMRNFTDIPFTYKNEVLEDQLTNPPYGSNLCVGQEQIQRIHRTSGTTMRPLLLPLTKKDIEAITDSGRRAFVAAGLTPEDTVFHCLNFCMWAGGVTDHLCLEATGASVIPYGVGNSRNLIETMITIRPTAIHCTPSYLAKLEDIITHDFNMTPRDLGLKKGFFGGESGLQNPVFRKSIEDKWGFVAMNANYGLSDVLSIFGAECQYRDGLHFTGGGNIFPELIDPDTGISIPIRTRNKGELVLTNLNKQAMPWLRYKTGDLIEIVSHEKCLCGRTSFRFNVIGRSDDMLVIKGINIFPSTVENIIGQYRDVLNMEYQIIAEDVEPLEYCTLKAEYRQTVSKDMQNKIQQALDKKIREKLFISMTVELVPEGTLPRTEGKSRRVIKIKK